MFFLNKEFCANRISLRVKTGISLLDEKHLVDKTIKFSLALFQNTELAFFEEAWPWAVEKLQSIYVICRGLKFSLPERVSLIEVQATFEKAYWKIEPLLEDPAMKTRHYVALHLTTLSVDWFMFAVGAR